MPRSKNPFGSPADDLRMKANKQQSYGRVGARTSPMYEDGSYSINVGGRYRKVETGVSRGKIYKGR